MKIITNKYLASAACSVLFLCVWLALDAHAQTAAAQAHIAAAQAAMAPKVKNPYRPFETYKALFDQMCAPPKQLPDVIRVELEPLRFAAVNGRAPQHTLIPGGRAFLE